MCLANWCGAARDVKGENYTPPHGLSIVHYAWAAIKGSSDCPLWLLQLVMLYPGPEAGIPPGDSVARASIYLPCIRDHEKVESEMWRFCMPIFSRIQTGLHGSVVKITQAKTASR